MFGHAAFADSAFANVGGILIIGTAEMDGLAVSTNVGSGTLVGVATIDGNFTQTSTGAGTFVGTSEQDFTQTVEAFRVDVNPVEVTADFTQTTAGIGIFSGVSSQDLNFTKTSVGDILFEEIDAGATVENWTEITHSGDTWTDKSASATTETWTERVV